MKIFDPLVFHSQLIRLATDTDRSCSGVATQLRLMSLFSTAAAIYVKIYMVSRGYSVPELLSREYSVSVRHL